MSQGIRSTDISEAETAIIQSEHDAVNCLIERRIESMKSPDELPIVFDREALPEQRHECGMPMQPLMVFMCMPSKGFADRADAMVCMIHC